MQLPHALRALKHIKNTGQTSTRLRIHWVWPQASPRPNAEQCRAWQGTSHQFLIFGVHPPLFHLLHHWSEELGNFSSHTWHQHGHIHMAHTPLSFAPSERTDGKTSLLNLPEQHQDISDELGGTYCPWETEVEPNLWNKQDPSHHYEELPQNFFKPQCLCYLLIQSEK